jgi:hypothetical protein
MASGDTLLVWTALNNEPTDADYATLDTILTTSADEPDDVVPVLDFTSVTTNEHASFSGIMPNHYAGTTGVTVTLLWTSEATTGDVKWDVAFKALADSADLLGKTYADENTVTTTTDGTARNINTSAITFTDGADMDSVAINELFRLTVIRDVVDAADTMNSNDAELIAVLLKET